PYSENLAADLILSYIRKKFADANLSEMNKIRKSIFLATDEFLTKIIDGKDVPSILTITAPTGGGKTLLGLHVALKLMDKLLRKSKIVYCLPYINIIEQTYSLFEDVLSIHYGRKPDLSILLKHHHLSFPAQESISKEVTLEKLLLLVDSWESEIIVTTFEQLLRSMIGCRNSLLKKFHNLAHSIIILDEIQAIPLEYWKLICDVLSYLVKHFNTKIILMTATMPAIFKDEGFELVPKFKTYFKRIERVKLNLQLEKTVSAEEFADFFLSKWTKGSSALLVLNTIETSKRVYERIAQRLGENVARLSSKNNIDPTNPPRKTVLAYLSTSVIPKERERRVKILKLLLKEHHSVILVSTQVVEAGVDLDFDMAFRDLGPLDSIVQVAGRCNRNWRTSIGQVYVLRIADEKGREDSKKIYGKILPQITLELIGDRKYVSERELVEIVESYYKDVSYRVNVEKHPESMEVLEKITRLNFHELYNFSLIKEEPKVPVYIEYDDNAKCLLKKFKCLIRKLRETTLNLEKIFECKANLRKMRAEMESYIVEVYQSEHSLKSLNSIMDDVNVLVVPHETIEAYYDSETGFKSTKSREEDFFII
ncbi:MAG: CRISPR-associated helicase Cas3', partial [Candidatus Bathyarchaeia archaeon]